MSRHRYVVLSSAPVRNVNGHVRVERDGKLRVQEYHDAGVQDAAKPTAEGLADLARVHYQLAIRDPSVRVPEVEEIISAPRIRRF